MSGSRLSTVYDFSSLRLHPDGSRVHQTSKNLRPRNALVSVQDSRGNWFARDAAGLGSVKGYRRVRDDTEGEKFDFGEAESEQSEYKGEGKGKAKVATGRGYDQRPAKRRKFAQDFDFLETPSFSTPTEEPLPSSVNTTLYALTSPIYWYKIRICSNVSTISRVLIIMSGDSYSMRLESTDR